MPEPDQPPLSTSTPGRPRRRTAVLLAAGLAAVLLIAAGSVAYVMGAFDDDGAFRAEPPACETLLPSLHLLGTPYTGQQDRANNCDLFLSEGPPELISVPVMTVSYHVATPARGDAPEAASRLLRKSGPQFAPLPGIGDEARSRGRSVYLRVSNLIVAINVFPRAVGTEAQIHAFAADLAGRLRRG